MRSKIILALAAAAFLSTSTLTSSNQNLGTGIVPENDMWIGVHDKSASKAMTKEVFDNVIDRVEKIYSPIVEDMGYRLQIIRKWDDGTVNAYARRVGSTMEVNMFGGLARHAAITPDGFAMVVCHETGHHLGGAPKLFSLFGSWASNEGQSDYWAATKCMKKVFEPDNNTQIISNMQVPASVVSACNEVFTHANDSALCQRISMAGLSLGSLFNSLSQTSIPLSFDTPDSSRVDRTYDKHPKAQCRLDTYFQATLCDVGHDVDVSDTDATIGTCNMKDGYTRGYRPLCWYKP